MKRLGKYILMLPPLLFLLSAAGAGFKGNGEAQWAYVLCAVYAGLVWWSSRIIDNYAKLVEKILNAWKNDMERTFGEWRKMIEQLKDKTKE